MTEETYTWTDNAIEAGAVCDTDIANENIMHMRYTYRQSMEATYNSSTATLNIGTITDKDTYYNNGDYISDIKMPNGELLTVGGLDFPGLWIPVTDNNILYNGTLTANQNFFIDLTSYIPNTTAKYDVLIDCEMNTTTTNNSEVVIGIMTGSDPNDSSYTGYDIIGGNTRTASTHIAYSNVVIKDLTPNHYNIRVFNRTNYATGNIIIRILAIKRRSNVQFLNTNIEKINDKKIGGYVFPGQWYNENTVRTGGGAPVSNATIKNKSSLEVDLSEFMPIDEYQYEVFLNIYARTYAYAARDFRFTIDSGILTGIKTIAQITRTNSYESQSRQIIIPIFPGERKITINNTASYDASSVKVFVSGFRRMVREN